MLSNFTALQIASFWDRVDKDGPTVREDLGPCWEWAGSVTGGYGYVGFGKNRVTKSKHTYVHRLSWEIHYGNIPEGLWVLHRCDNQLCVRPDHLFVGTNKDNMQDAKNKGRKRGDFRRWTLSTEEVQNVIWKHLSGMSLRNIASDYKLTFQQIQRIVSGKAYRKVPRPYGPPARRRTRGPINRGYYNRHDLKKRLEESAALG